ncbi:MAG: hypothetical protein IT454_12470 [Planctomycetes bacterium]|nr:hypothetical protein [Planctomycetota bacterium]
MKRLRSLVAVTLALLAGRAAHALGDQTQFLADGKLEVRVSSPWPAHLSQGVAPIFVDVSNQGDTPRVVSLRAQCNDWTAMRTIDSTFELAAGERAHVELLAPAMGAWDNDYSLQVTTRGSSSSASFGSVCSGGAPQGYSSVLVLGESEVPESVVTSWIERCSDARVNTGYGATAPSTPDNVQIGHARFEQMPRSASAYTSLDLAVLDISRGWPSDNALGPLLAWVRNGGALLVSGPDAPELARRHALFAAWLEPRFVREEDGTSHALCGLGRLMLVNESELMESQRVRELVRASAQRDLGFWPSYNGGSRSAAADPRIPDVGRVPYRVFALLLIVFAILIGPVNFIWVRRLRKPVMLLVTIPALAIGTSIVLLVYGVFIQGLDVKTASVSVAVLDQREHRSACVEKRMLFAGMAPSDGLRPGPGTAVQALSSSVTTFGAVRDRLNLDIELTPNVLLKGDFLPTRAVVLQLLSTERAERARLDLDARGESYEVTNNLGADVERLVLRDRAGNYFWTDARLAAGGHGTLQAVPAESGEELARTLLAEPMVLSPELDWTASFAAQRERLPIGTYVASLRRTPFSDDCGVATNEIVGSHRLFGVLPLELEAWR